MDFKPQGGKKVKGKTQIQIELQEGNGLVPS